MPLPDTKSLRRVKATNTLRRASPFAVPALRVAPLPVSASGCVTVTKKTTLPMPEKPEREEDKQERPDAGNRKGRHCPLPTPEAPLSLARLPRYFPRALPHYPLASFYSSTPSACPTPAKPPNFSLPSSARPPTHESTWAACKSIIQNSSSDDSTTNDMSPKGKKKGKARSKFSGPAPTPPPSRPLPPLPSMSQAPGLLSLSFAALDAVREQNQLLLLQRPPKTPPNSPAQADQSNQQSRPHRPDCYFNQAVDNAPPVPPLSPKRKARFKDGDAGSSSPSSYFSFSSSSSALDWHPSPTPFSDPFSLPWSLGAQDQSFEVIFGRSGSSRLTDKELCPDPMKDLDGDAPYLEEAPALPRPAAPLRLPALPDHRFELQRLRRQQMRYKRAVARGLQFSAVRAYHDRKLDGVTEEIRVDC
jgi:hypothetical protein